MSLRSDSDPAVWLWQSTKPGTSQHSDISTTWAPSGIFASEARETPLIFPFSTMTTALLTTVSDGSIVTTLATRKARMGLSAKQGSEMRREDRLTQRCRACREELRLIDHLLDLLAAHDHAPDDGPGLEGMAGEDDHVPLATG